jgi:hypothetical protein
MGASSEASSTAPVARSSKEANHRHRRLLRVRRERPRRRAANKRDEFASFHWITSRAGQ